MAYPGAASGSMSALVASDRTTVVPAAGLGAKKPLGRLMVTGAWAGSEQLLGSVMVNVWDATLITLCTLLQFALPAMATVRFTWLGRTKMGVMVAAVLPAVIVMVPLPITAELGMKLMATEGTTPLCTLLTADPTAVTLPATAQR